MTTHPYLSHPLPIAFAHRGGTETGGENTVEAFDHAYGLGVRYMETDVHLTRDGVLVAFHDATLTRLSGQRRWIAQMPWHEVSEVELEGGGRIPRLEELLQRWPEVRWNLDPKADRVVEPLARVLRAPQLLERVCVGSFSGRRLRALRRLLGADLCSSASPGEVLRCLGRRRMWPVPAGLHPSVRCLQVPPKFKGMTLVDGPMVRWAHERGLQVHVWTIDEPDEMERLLGLGVDGLMTDKPTTLTSTLKRRGLWSVTPDVDESERAHRS